MGFRTRFRRTLSTAMLAWTRLLRGKCQQICPAKQQVRWTLDAATAFRRLTSRPEKHRIRVRKTTAAKQDKENKFRKCYIAQKIISVPCDKNGDAVEAYDPHLNAHPYDTAWPPTGENMFEDIEVLPTGCTDSKKKKKMKQSSVTRRDESGDETSSAEEVDAAEVDETLAEGARWLREQEELEHRRAEERTRRRRAAAQPTIISSSPDTEMSDFVVDTQTSPRSTTPTPQAPQKKRDRKRKRLTHDETATTPTAQRAKSTTATPKTPSTAQAGKLQSVSLKAVLSVKKSNNGKGRAEAHSRAHMSKKSSKRVCGIL